MVSRCSQALRGVLKEPKEALAASRAVDWVLRDTGSVIYGQREKAGGNQYIASVSRLLPTH